MFWPFDSDTSDFYDVYNGESVNNITYTSPGYTGYGSALSLHRSLSQYVVVSKYLDLSYTSFTFEVWINTATISISNNNLSDNAIIGQCDSLTADKCLSLALRNGRVLMSFYGNDLSGSTVLTVGRWYHIAYVYDYTVSNQIIYVNGVLDGSQISNPYLGTVGNLTIGTSMLLTSNNYFDGFIDQLYFVSRAKNATEILSDATLVVYYSFDGNPTSDSGPLYINGTSVNATYVSGRLGQALSFASNGYFRGTGFTQLG
ncbi:unnamed protein product, partial [Didymodactylos carnosus]